MGFLDVVSSFVTLQDHHMSQCHSVSNLMGKIVFANQERKQFIFLAEFKYLVITFRKCKLLIRTQLFQEVVYLTV